MSVITVSRDEFVKPNTTAEALSALKPAFRNGGSVTAGNASGLNDGAAAMLIASETALTQFSLKPLAKIVCAAVSGVAPSIMGIGPVEASRKALRLAGLSMSDIGVIEINEAFAAVGIASMRDLGIPDDVVNVNGGAIALGHPIGMSGNRLALTLLYELNRRGGGVGAAALCGGGGQGDALIVRTVS